MSGNPNEPKATAIAQTPQSEGKGGEPADFNLADALREVSRTLRARSTALLTVSGTLLTRSRRA